MDRTPEVGSSTGGTVDDGGQLTTGGREHGATAPARTRAGAPHIFGVLTWAGGCRDLGAGRAAGTSPNGSSDTPKCPGHQFREIAAVPVRRELAFRELTYPVERVAQTVEVTLRELFGFAGDGIRVDVFQQLEPT